MGSKIIENIAQIKMKGPDHKASLNPEFEILTKRIRFMEIDGKFSKKPSKVRGKNKN